MNALLVIGLSVARVFRRAMALDALATPPACATSAQAELDCTPSPVARPRAFRFARRTASSTWYRSSSC
jgi:hypothetical protein